MLKPHNFKVGDRVARQISIGSPEEKLGYIAKAYHDSPGYMCATEAMYDIIWDGAESEDVGYLECGIRKVEDGSVRAEAKS